MARQTTTQRILIALSSTLLLAGCTSPAPSPSAPAETPAATTEPAAAPRPVPSEVLAPVPLAGASGSTPSTGSCASAAAAPSGSIGEVDLESVRDSGPTTGATGTVTTATDGSPASYLVAGGDISAEIAERFCVSPEFLDALNSVRRDGVGIDSLYAGDTLNLSPSTVLSVGDQNGRVLDNDAPDPLPEQED